MATSDKRELTFIARLQDIVSRPLKKIGDQADDTKDDLDKVNQGLKKLDQQSAAATKTIEGLRKEVAKTGDLDLTKDIAKQEARLKAFARQRKSLIGDGAGEDEATGFVAKFVGRAGPLLASAPLSGPLVGSLAAAAPAVAGIVAGAVTLGVGLASAGAGLKIAFSDPEVKAAGKSLADELGADLKDAAKPFVPEAKRAIGIVRQEWQSLRPDLEGIFADGAKYVAPLTRAATGFARELAPGLREANKNAGPLIETLGEHGPKAGETFGNALKALSETAKTSAADIDGALTGIEMTITTTAAGIDLMNKVGPWVGKSPVLGWLGEWNDKSKDNTKANEEAAAATEATAKRTAAYADAAAQAARNTEFWTTRLKESKDANMASERATMDLEEAIDAAAAAGKKNNDGISVATEKGRANRDLLLGLADATNAAADAVRTQTGSQDLANAKQAEGRAAFLRSAEAMGVSRAEAKRLADQLFAIPNVKPKVELNVNQALNDATRIENRLKQVARQYSAKVILTSSFGGAAHTGAGYSTGYADGGPVENLPGPKGVDSGFIKAAKGEHVWTAAEVDAVGGQAAMERMRRQVRSGRMPAAPGGAVAGGVSAAPAPAPVFDVRVFIGDRELTDLVDVRISESNRGLSRRVTAGSGTR